jgi:hypothetical protein
MIGRRASLAFLGGAVLTAFLPSISASHTLYPQWLAYRKKHLLIGCHRKDMETWRQAERLVNELNHALPKAKARVARAPHPERLASLIGTDQMELAVLGRGEAVEMRDGTGKFAPYGRIALSELLAIGDHVLVAEESFPVRHGWMVAAALAAEGLDAGPDPTNDLAPHSGALAFRQGRSLDELK